MNPPQRIKTKPFHLNQQQFIRLMVRNFIVRRWWGVLAAGAFIIAYMIATGRDEFSVTAMLLLGLGFLLGLPYYIIRRQAIVAHQQIFSQPIRCEMDINGLYFYTHDGRVDQVNIGTIRYVDRARSYFIIYLIDESFYIIPFSAFASADDIYLFKSLFKHHKKFMADD